MGSKNSVCQSCGMPFRKEEDYGTNASGDRSEEYCVYCFENGKFLDEGITLEEKINKNVRFGVQMGMSEPEARKMASEILPKLKRWNRQNTMTY